jgi:hypothetical protein
MAPNQDDVAPRFDPGEGVLLVRKRVERLTPGPHRELLGLVNLPIAINNEDMVISHEGRQTIQVLRVDALAELQSDEVSCGAPPALASPWWRLLRDWMWVRAIPLCEDYNFLFCFNAVLIMRPNCRSFFRLSIYDI